jgi:hypothetical protein
MGVLRDFPNLWIARRCGAPTALEWHVQSVGRKKMLEAIQQSFGNRTLPLLSQLDEAQKEERERNDAKQLSILDWYFILRAHGHWTVLQAIRHALWLTR